MSESASLEQRLAHLRAMVERRSEAPQAGVDLTEQRQRLEKARAQVLERLREATEKNDTLRMGELREKARHLAQKIALVSEAPRSSGKPSEHIADGELRARIVEFLAWAREQEAPLSAHDRGELQAIAASLVRKRREALQSLESSLQAARKHALQGVVLIRELCELVDTLRDGEVLTGVRRLPFESQRHLAANQFGLSKQSVMSATGLLQTLATQWPELRGYAALPDWSALPFDEILGTLVPAGELTSPVEASRLAMRQRLRAVDDLGAATVLWLSELLSQAAALPGPAVVGIAASAPVLTD